MAAVIDVDVIKTEATPLDEDEKQPGMITDVEVAAGVVVLVVVVVGTTTRAGVVVGVMEVLVGAREVVVAFGDEEGEGADPI